MLALAHGRGHSPPDPSSAPPHKTHTHTHTCVQVRVTGAVSALLPSFLPPLLFGSPDPIERLALDDERHVLYALGANSSIQV